MLIITFEYLHNLLNCEKKNKPMNQQQPGLFGQKKINLFGKPKQQPVQQGPAITEQINSLNGRLRVLEERLSNVNRKVEIEESNSIEKQKKINIEFKTLNSEIIEIKRTMESIQEKLNVITRELPNLAAKDELDVLKKYIEMWEPMHFVTRDELDKRLKEELLKNKS